MWIELPTVRERFYFALLVLLDPLRRTVTWFLLSEGGDLVKQYVQLFVVPYIKNKSRVTGYLDIVSSKLRQEVLNSKSGYPET